MFQDNTWVCEPFLYKPSIYLGALDGATVEQLDIDTGVGTFQNLSLTNQGQYVIDFNCLSTPNDYNFTFSTEVITVYPPAWAAVIVERTAKTLLRFQGDYNTIASGEEVYVGATVYNHLWTRYPSVTFTQFKVSAGQYFSSTTSQQIVCSK
jgi:hypothetical protein